MKKLIIIFIVFINISAKAQFPQFPQFYSGAYIDDTVLVADFNPSFCPFPESYKWWTDTNITRVMPGVIVTLIIEVNTAGLSPIDSIMIDSSAWGGFATIQGYNMMELSLENMSNGGYYEFYWLHANLGTLKMHLRFKGTPAPAPGFQYPVNIITFQTMDLCASNQWSSASGTATVGTCDVSIDQVVGGPVCAGENGDIDITVSGTHGPFNFMWDDLSNTTTEDLNGVKSGIYTVLVTDTVGCTDTLTHEITNAPAPTVDINDDTIIMGDNSSVKINTIYSNDISIIEWTPNLNILSSTSLEPIVNPASSMWYYVSVENNFGCIQVDSVFILVNEQIIPLDSIAPEILCEMVIPTAFTPDGDGVNDTWNISCLDNVQKLNIKIFNRWGNLVFETGGDEYIPWSGENYTCGSYYFLIEFEDEVEGMKNFKGTINLIK